MEKTELRIKKFTNKDTSEVLYIPQIKILEEEKYGFLKLRKRQVYGWVNFFCIAWNPNISMHYKDTFTSAVEATYDPSRIITFNNEKDANAWLLNKEESYLREDKKRHININKTLAALSMYDNE
jgi:hypothetical protein